VFEERPSLQLLLHMTIWSFCEDDIFYNDELCISFSTSSFPHHDQDTIPDVLKNLQDVLHGFVSPSSQLVAGNSSAPLSDCFHKVPKLIHPKHNLKHQDLLQFHLPVLYQVVGAHFKTSKACIHVCHSMP